MESISLPSLVGIIRLIHGVNVKIICGRPRQRRAVQQNYFGLEIFLEIGNVRLPFAASGSPAVNQELSKVLTKFNSGVRKVKSFAKVFARPA